MACTDRLQILSQLGEFDTALTELEVWRQELDEDMFERLGGGERMAAYLARQQGEIFLSIEKPQEAIEPLSYAKSFRLAELNNTPENLYQKVQLLTANNSLVSAYNALEEYETAGSLGEESVSLAREIIAADPQDVGGAEALNGYAKAQFGLNAPEVASAAARESVTVARGLVRQFPGDTFFEKLLASALITTVEILPVDAQTETACASLSEAGVLTERAISEETSPALSRRLDTVKSLAAERSCN